MEALSEKHKNTEIWLHTTLANNPRMKTMNKFVQMGLVKNKNSELEQLKPYKVRNSEKSALTFSL